MRYEALKDLVYGLILEDLNITIVNERLNQIKNELNLLNDVNGIEVLRSIVFHAFGINKNKLL